LFKVKVFKVDANYILIMDITGYIVLGGGFLLGLAIVILIILGVFIILKRFRRSKF